jgi:hypothetical protein
MSYNTFYLTVPNVTLSCSLKRSSNLAGRHKVIVLFGGPRVACDELAVVKVQYVSSDIEARSPVLKTFVP